MTKIQVNSISEGIEKAKTQSFYNTNNGFLATDIYVVDMIPYVSIVRKETHTKGEFLLFTIESDMQTLNVDSIKEKIKENMNSYVGDIEFSIKHNEDVNGKVTIILDIELFC